jgi:hypothetical protein
MPTVCRAAHLDGVLEVDGGRAACACCDGGVVLGHELNVLVRWGCFVSASNTKGQEGGHDHDECDTGSTTEVGGANSISHHCGVEIAAHQHVTQQIATQIAHKRTWLHGQHHASS